MGVNKNNPPRAAQNEDMDFTPLGGGGEIQLGTTPKAVTPFGGLASFIAWLRNAGFHQAAAAAMP